MKCCILGVERQGRWSGVNIYLDSYMVTGFWIHLLCLCVTGALADGRNGGYRKRRLIAAALLCTAIDTTLMVVTISFGKTTWSSWCERKANSVMHAGVEDV